MIEGYLLHKITLCLEFQRKLKVRVSYIYVQPSCVVLTLNADHSFPHNEMIMHQRYKRIVFLKNIDKRVELFTYPLFYPAGTDSFHIKVPLQIPYGSRSYIFKLERAQYRLDICPAVIKYLTVSAIETDLRVLHSMHFTLKTVLG